MVLCIVALVVLAVLALFSARYRPLAREAFDCTLRKVTLRPCASDLDQRLKARLVAKVLRYSPSAARVLSRNFALLSFLFTLLFFASLAYSALAVYNYAAFGNCNGPLSAEGCVLQVLGNGSPGAVPAGCPVPSYSPYLPSPAG